MPSLPALALDRCPDAVFVTCEDGRITYVNRTACQWLHYRRDELLDLALWDIDVQIEEDAWETNWQVLRENRILTIKTEYTRRDQSVVPVDVIAMLEDSRGDDRSPIQVAITYARNVANPMGQLEVTVRGVLREKALGRLNSQERSVFEMLERDAPEKEITQRLKISRSTFYRIKRRISEKLGAEGTETRGFWW